VVVEEVVVVEVVVVDVVVVVGVLEGGKGVVVVGPSTGGVEVVVVEVVVVVGDVVVIEVVVPVVVVPVVVVSITSQQVTSLHSGSIGFSMTLAIKPAPQVFPGYSHFQRAQPSSSTPISILVPHFSHFGVSKSTHSNFGQPHLSSFSTIFWHLEHSKATGSSHGWATHSYSKAQQHSPPATTDFTCLHSHSEQSGLTVGFSHFSKSSSSLQVLHGRHW
jgi:hypothetical protein